MLRHYRVDAKIGEGGMGIVYRGWDTHLDRPVAIKVLSPQAMTNPDRKRRFVQEAKSASALNHPHIVTIYDVDSVDAVDFIAMEYIDGQTLDHRIGSRGMRINLALNYSAQVADALTRAHGAGIVHRDLKPGNIMVDKHEQVKVLDFGLAKLTEPDNAEPAATLTLKPNTEEGTIVGTVAYMSPEQAEGKIVDARSDIFSFGSLLYEMVTGLRPFQGETKLSTLSAILSKNPEPASARAPEVPRELERIISRCLRKSPDRRFQQMAEVKLALEDLREESESSATGRAAAVVKPKRGRLIWLAAALAVLIAAGGAFLWWRSRPARPNGPAPMTRVTSDPGLTTDPALSPDGKLLTYASDRATGENLDIWVQHLGGGDPVRLTSWDSDEMEPDFSPDGSHIVFRSTRQGGGIYVVPVLGGEPVLVAPKGFRPRYSPDGNWIAYSVATEGAMFSNIAYDSFVAPAAGGTPRHIAADLQGASYPVWSPDSSGLILAGAKSRSEPRDWWIVPIEGGPSRSTEMTSGLRSRKSPLVVTIPGAWTHDGQWIVFSAGTEDNSNLYRVRIERGARITEEPERITFGTAVETKPSLSHDGQLALASQVFTSHLWSLPADTNRAKLLGPMTQITTDQTVNTWPRISPDGKALTYFTEAAGSRKLYLRNVENGRQRQLLPAFFFPPQMAYGVPLVAGGTKVVFAAGANGSAVFGTYVLDLNAAAPVLVKEKSTVLCASEDGRHILVSMRAGPTTAVDTVNGNEVPFAPTGGTLLSLQFSPDGRWVAFHRINSPATRQIYVMPFHEDRATPQSEWIPVTDGKQLDREPQWSPDGNLLYFLADREGSRGIYAQRLDPASKRPVGGPFEVQMFRSARRSMMHFTNSGDSWPAVARDKIVFPLGEMTGNIWITRLPLR